MAIYPNMVINEFEKNSILDCEVKAIIIGEVEEFVCKINSINSVLI